MPIYLDHAATTPIRREVLDKMLTILCHFTGGPSGAHSVARRADMIKEEARRATLDCLGVESGQIRFVTGGRQASELAVLGLALGHKSGHVITTTDEDEGVLAACRTLERQGFRVSYLPLDEQGLLDLDLLEETLDADTVLVSVALVNRFTGCRQPFEELIRLCGARDVLIHSDFSLGCLLDLELDSLRLDAISLSSHLLGGPHDIGALWTRDGLELQHPCLECENLANIVGFTQALCYLADERSDWVASLRGLENEFSGLLTNALPLAEFCLSGWHAGILTLRVPSTVARHLVYHLDRWGVCVSETPYGVRFSLGRTTTSQELAKTVLVLESALRSQAQSSLGVAS